MKHIAIIGNGIAGITAARHLRKLSDLRITVISSESEYFFSRTALMYVYMGDMEWRHIEPYEKDFWKKNRIDLKYANVERVLVEKKELELTGGESLSYDELILATGSTYKRPEIQGINCEGVFGMYSKQDFDGIWQYTKGKKYRQPKIKKAVVLGGGLIGIELTEMLVKEGIEVTMVIRDDRFYSNIIQEKESEILESHISKHHVSLIKSNGIREIRSENGVIKNVELIGGEVVETDFLGLTIGVSPNVGWLKDSGIEIATGILVNEYLQTNIEHIYAIGDCAEQRVIKSGRKAIEPVWYTGRMMGECVARNIVKSKSCIYNPGIWFNSAKFFDIEYQIYGYVAAKAESQDQLFWQKNNSIIRVGFDQQGRLEGIQSLVFRIRHEVAEDWIRRGVTKDYLNENFDKILFDPEFSMTYKEKIQF
jgi:NAD(P)H-nitrite reductase large subunit